jgi:ABC-2 type transport system ATP-binding protein
MIAVHQLTRRYGPTVALLDVSATIQPGEVVGLLGHNGAGKTTMMKILTGYLEPSAGSAQVCGFDVVSQRQSAQAAVGYLPESAPLYPEMTVAEYLMSMAALRGVPTSVRGKAVAEAVEAVDLGPRVNWRIGNLSKGLRQRVGLAQAIVHRPRVLILDEPTNGLDPSQIEGMRDLIRRLAQTSTILLSTHILQEVEAVCGRVLVLVGGRLVADGTLAGLTQSAELRISARGGSNLPARLAGVPGVLGASVAGPDPEHAGFTLFVVHGDGTLPDAPAVARAVYADGAELATLAPIRRTLEDVFRELQHAGRAA